MSADSIQMRSLSIKKGGQVFCVLYEPGQEFAVLDAVMDMVHRRVGGFDWFDAALLSCQLGQHLAADRPGEKGEGQA